MMIFGILLEQACLRVILFRAVAGAGRQGQMCLSTRSDCA
ncbi:Protein of unknown function [Pyronema omphalodes CBS 100304]|uniref:Uncharacterized protein n=1 Tax=Pyronema omphalodes (strain CBS 100304) TaxID=1076935 RepID=U4L3F4_PYROM|nr:Protein of unknown function [Pyronema omphalodes CBS 100304]